MPVRVRPEETKCFGFTSDPETNDQIGGAEGASLDNQVIGNWWLGNLNLVLCDISAALTLINGSLVLLRSDLNTRLDAIADSLGDSTVDVDTTPIVQEMTTLRQLLDDKFLTIQF